LRRNANRAPDLHEQALCGVEEGVRDVSLLEFGEGEIVQENLEVQEMAGGDVKTLGNWNEALGGSGNP